MAGESGESGVPEPTRPQVYLHVGTAKSGTTYVQGLLWANRTRLRDQGVVYPGAHPMAHYWASLDLRGIKFNSYDDPAQHEAWPRLVKRVRAWDGRASVISHELLAGSRPRVIARAMSDLDFADVHIILTLRDLARTLPSSWQEWIKNCEIEGYGEWLRLVREEAHAEPVPDPRRAGPVFWNLQNAPVILKRWQDAGVPPERIHVVTVPPRGTAEPTTLWNRFAEVLGVDPADFDLDVGAKTNETLPAVGASVLRKLNVELRRVDFPWPVYHRRVKFGAAPALAALGGAPIELPQDSFDWAVDWAHGMVDSVTASGYQVVGDLGEVIPSERPLGADPDDPDPKEESAAALVVALRFAEVIAELASARNAERAAAKEREAAAKQQAPASSAG